MYLDTQQHDKMQVQPESIYIYIFFNHYCDSFQGTMQAHKKKNYENHSYERQWMNIRCRWRLKVE